MYGKRVQLMDVPYEILEAATDPGETKKRLDHLIAQEESANKTLAKLERRVNELDSRDASQLDMERMLKARAGELARQEQALEAARSALEDEKTALTERECALKQREDNLGKRGAELEAAIEEHTRKSNDMDDRAARLDVARAEFHEEKAKFQKNREELMAVLRLFDG